MPQLSLDWTDLPLHIVLCEWFVKNAHFPTDMGTLVAYIGIFLLAWYAIIWTVRLVISIIWPLFIISTAVVVFRLLQYYDPEEITNIAVKTFSFLADSMVRLMAKGLDLVLSFT